METPEAPRNSDRHSIPRTITPLSGVPAVSRVATLRFPLLQTQIEQVVNDALNEDGAYDDITTIATIVSDRRSRGALVARQNGVVAGVPLAVEAFRLLDPKASIRVEHEDGARMKIEVECDNLAQVEDAVAANADIILLDNMTADQLRDAVKLVSGRAILEASGGVTLTTVRAIAETGVDWISIGALTHSPPAMDIGLDFD